MSPKGKFDFEKKQFLPGEQQSILTIDNICKYAYWMIMLMLSLFLMLPELWW